MKGCWILSNAFSASVQMIVFSFILLIWYVTLIYFHMLYYPGIPRINLICSWYILLKIFVICTYKGYWSVIFFYCDVFFKKNIYLFIWLCQVLVASGIFSCSMWDLQLRHVGSSSLTRDQTWAPCIGSTESQLLDHQGSPSLILIIKILSAYYM